MILLQNLQAGLSLGILWGIAALGVYITFRILNIADLTCDGSFALGGCINGILLLNGANPLFALLIAIIGGMLSGLITGLFHTLLKIPPILSGILTMIALYSVGLRVLGGPNKSLLGKVTLFTYLSDELGIPSSWSRLLVGVIVSAFVIALLYWFFGTELGCAIRATGNNEYMVRALGVDTNSIKLLGLVISNGLIALSGALISQLNRTSDVGDGRGAIVITLASIVIGEVIFGKRFNFVYILVSVVIGAAVYRMIIAIVLYLGLNTDDMKLFTALVVALALGIPAIKQQLSLKRTPA